MNRRLVIAVLAILAAYGTFRGISCALRSDRDRIRELIQTITSSFASGSLRSIRTCLTEDFEVLHRRREYAWDDMRGFLAGRFIGGDRLILSGGIATIDIDEAGTTAVVTWKGEAWWKPASGTVRRGRVYAGTGTLRVRKEGGSWLLAHVEADDDA